MEMALYPRTDGLLEPRTTRAMEWIKQQCPGTVIVGRFVDNVRSDLQNRYLNGWIYKQACRALNEAGYSIRGMTFTRARLHAMCQQLFLVVEEVPLASGRISYIYESTASMSTKRFCEYGEEVKNWLHQDFGISVPDPKDPGDQYYIELHRQIYGTGRPD